MSHCFRQLQRATFLFSLGFFSSSQEFGDFVKVSLFEVVKAGEKSVEILSEVQNLLRHLNYVFLFSFCRLHQFMHNFGRNQSIPFKLLANLQSHIEGADCNQAWLLAAQLVIVHRHLAQIHCHLEYEQF